MNVPTIIQCAPDGPLLVRGPTKLVSPDGKPWATAKTTALCRCGSSANKPFCDGKHRAAGFSDAGARPQPQHAASPSAPGAPQCTVHPAGPYALRGALRLEGFDGQGEELYLCRCGGSGNKPFCDGSHKTNGFQG